MFFKRYHLVLIMQMSKLFCFRHRKCLMLKDIADAWRGKMRSAGSFCLVQKQKQKMSCLFMQRHKKYVILLVKLLFAQMSVCLSLLGGASFGQAASSILPSFAWFR